MLNCLKIVDAFSDDGRNAFTCIDAMATSRMSTKDEFIALRFALKLCLPTQRLSVDYCRDEVSEI